jgi:hypothetical protein
MRTQKGDRLSAWVRLCEALGSLTSKMAWALVAIVILAAVGRHLYVVAPGKQRAARHERRTTVSVPSPIPWQEVDHAMVEALRTAHQVAEEVATARLQTWVRDLEQRIDADFLTWYFSYV